MGMRGKMNVLFVASIAPIVRDAEAARAFYEGALSSFEGGAGEYRYTHRLAGTKHFGLWPLAQAATACFGTAEWPDVIPVPQASVEFEVPDVQSAAAELEAKGYRLIHQARTEPWGQITARLLSPEGLLVAVCYTPGVPRRAGDVTVLLGAVADRFDVVAVRVEDEGAVVGGVVVRA